MSPRILLLPGWLDSDDDHWQSHWERKFGYQRVIQEDWVHPDREKWVNQLSQVILGEEAPVILVAHSLGCHLVTQWAFLNLNCAKARVLGALLVAPPNLECANSPSEILAFHPMIRQPLPFPATVIASSNDPYGDEAQIRILAAEWEAKFECVGSRGHLNSESGLKEWKEGQQFLKALVGAG